MSYVESYYEEPQGNYLLAHWRGDLPLAKSFWINGFLVSLVVTILLAAIGNALEDSAMGITASSIILLVMTTISILLSIWAWVGIWRSSIRHPDRGGSAGWAALAQLSVFLGAVKMLVSLGSLGAWWNETMQLAAGGDTLGEMAQVSASGTDLLLEGVLANGVADRFDAVLAANPQARRLVVNSAGGRIYEAERIAAAATRKGLDVTVHTQCSSACTLILLAGKTRSLEMNSGVGFHRPTYAGLDEVAHSKMAENLAQAYREKGLPARFVRRAMEAAPEDMWFPDEPLLFDAGVLNGFTAERIAADNELSVSNLAGKLPSQIDEMTVLEAVRADGKRLTYDYTLDLVDYYLYPDFEQVMTKSLRDEVCSRPLLPQFFASGAVFEYVYTDHAGRPVSTIRIDSCP